MDLVLALDAGTTSVRALALDERAQIVDSAQFDLTQYFPEPGYVEHDPAEIARLSVDVLNAVAERASARGDHVKALGLTNQRETTVAFDRATGGASHRALVWQDRRTTPQCEQLDRDGARAAVRSTTGLVLDPYFSGTKMRWLLDHGALHDAEQPALSTIDSFLVWTLTGGPHDGSFVTEPSNASRTMLMDLSTRQWSDAMGELVGVPLALLPRIVPSAGEFGRVSGAVVAELADVPIAGVLGDQQAALFGQACFAPGMVKATYGTGAFVLAHAGSMVPTAVDGLVATVAWDLGAHGSPAYALEGSSFVAGAAIQWLRDELKILATASDLEPLALSVDDAAGAVFVPAFTGLGSPFWRPEARGVLQGLARGTTSAHVARAVLEALAYQVRAMTDTFREAGVELRELRADGGAAAMDTLMQLQATNSRLVVQRSTSLEATARGAAMIAGLAVGVWSSLDELASLWSSSLRAEPAEASAVDAGYAAWRRAVQHA